MSATLTVLYCTHRGGVKDIGALPSWGYVMEYD